MCGCFCFVVVPYAFLAIVAFVFLWGCLVHVVFIHVLGCLFVHVFYLLNGHIKWVLLCKRILFSYYYHFFSGQPKNKQ